jgi:hypothetical protein
VEQVAETSKISAVLALLAVELADIGNLHLNLWRLELLSP